MNVLFVHGFGGGRGRLSRSIASAAAGGPHGLAFVRWPSGDLREMRARAVVDVARKVAKARSLPRGLMHAAIEGTKTASEAWEQAVANVPAGAAQLAAVLEETRPVGEPATVMAFSLGCRVVLYAISAGVIDPRKIGRLVFVASAAGPDEFRVLERVIAAGTEVIHVYSTNDTVLERLYPLGVGGRLASGRAALDMEGVENVRAQVNHLAYSSIADSLWALAVGEEAPALRAAPVPLLPKK
jgi:pimeloyl-ACP methyl ester carboxylesterase